MNIAIYWIQKDYGGVDTHLITLLNNWPNKNDNFILFTNYDNNGYFSIKEKIPKDIKLEVIKVKSGWFNNKLFFFKLLKLFEFLFFPIYFYFLKASSSNELKNRDIDILFVDNGGYPGSWKSLASLWAAQRLGILKRVLLIHHGSLHNNIIRRVGEKIVDFKISNWATDIITVSRATRKTLIDHRGWNPARNPIRVIHNGFDHASDYEGNKNLDIRELYKIDSDVSLIGIVGRVERYKGQEDLIIALSELPIEIRNKFHLLIVGKAVLQSELKRLEFLAKRLQVENLITFTGYLDIDINFLMSQLDILCMVTKDFEGFGLTIGEAMICGTPVICTNVGAVSEFVNDQLAWIVPPEEPSSIAEVLLLYKNNPSAFIDKSKKSITHIKKFSGKKMASQFYRILVLES
jgi:glycosyltransferase involved in cell wall biosynthesis